MKISCLSSGALFALASLAAFTVPAEAQIQEGETYTNHSIYFYWQPVDPANPANNLNDQSWLSYGPSYGWVDFGAISLFIPVTMVQKPGLTRCRMESQFRFFRINSCLISPTPFFGSR